MIYRFQIVEKKYYSGAIHDLGVRARFGKKYIPELSLEEVLESPSWDGGTVVNVVASQPRTAGSFFFLHKPGLKLFGDIEIVGSGEN